MHIAVLVFGRLNKCAEHYNNIRDSLGKENNIDFFLSSDNSSEALLNDFIRLYKPILYTNEQIKYTCDLKKYPGRLPVTNIHNMTCHFINKGRVFSLLEQHIIKENIQYDVIVSLRVELIFNNKFDFTNLENNTIYIPHGNDWINKGLNDQVAYGSLDVMKKYSSIFSNTINLLDAKVSIPHPESLTYANIHFYKLNVKRVNLVHRLER